MKKFFGKKLSRGKLSSSRAPSPPLSTNSNILPTPGLPPRSTLQDPLKNGPLSTNTAGFIEANPRPTNEELPDFVYQPLDVESQEIRLLKASDLQSMVNGTNPIVLELHTVSLRAKPKFLALSYTWGDPHLSDRIICNDRKLMVTKNLAQAIRTVFCAVRKSRTQLYEPGEDIYLWADAICINQNDLEEKGAQVSLMGLIYSTAKGAVGYIGAPKTAHPRAGFLAAMALANVVVTNNADGSDSRTPDIDMEAYRELWSQPWFNRSWVIQEMVLSLKTICLYGKGDVHVTWMLDTLAMLIERTQSHAHHPQKLIATDGNWNIGIAQTRVDAWANMKSTLEKADGVHPVFAVSGARLSEASDLRDKVYALMSLVDKTNLTMLPKFDYSSQTSVADVYSIFARSCIKSWGTDILLHAGTYQKISGLPTWVPDWSFEPRYPLYATLYNCSGTTKASLKLISPDKITIRAATVDSVSIISYPCNYHSEILIPHLPELRDTRLFVVAVEQMARNIVNLFSRNGGIYIRGENWDDVIWRTLTGDRAWGDTRAGPGMRNAFRAFGEFYSSNDKTVTGETQDVSSSGERTPEEDARLVEAALPFEVMTRHLQAGRVLGATSGGLIGVFPNDTRKQDVLAIVMGSSVPFVLRPVTDESKPEGGSSTKEYQIVGPCYLHGVMDGELVVEDKGEDGWKPIVGEWKDLTIV
jgi:hypothetical protein